MTTLSNDRFNAEAAAWDSNPDVHRASDDALKAILAHFPQLLKQKEERNAATQGYDVLEIGCGTGLLSFRIAPYVRSLVAVDAATGMIDALRMKLSKPDTPPNIVPLCIMLEDPEDRALPDARSDASGRMKFDLILSHLVLHHIPELQPLLRTMYGCLKPGGYIALTDFEDYGPEARKFHPESKMAGVERHGIKRTDMEGWMKSEGFENVDVKVGWTFRKDVEKFPGEWGHKKPDGDLTQQDFPFLLCVGQKPTS